MMMKQDVNWFLGTRYSDDMRVLAYHPSIRRVLSKYLNNTRMIQIRDDFFTPLMMILIMTLTTMMMTITMIMSNKWSAMPGLN